MPFSYKVAHDHLVTAESSIKITELLAYLKSSIIIMKSLHLTQLKNQEVVDSIKTAFDEEKSKEELELRKLVNQSLRDKTKLEKLKSGCLDS